MLEFQICHREAWNILEAEFREFFCPSLVWEKSTDFFLRQFSYADGILATAKNHYVLSIETKRISLSYIKYCVRYTDEPKHFLLITFSQKSSNKVKTWLAEVSRGSWK